MARRGERMTEEQREYVIAQVRAGTDPAVDRKAQRAHLSARERAVEQREGSDRLAAELPARFGFVRSPQAARPSGTAGSTDTPAS